MNIILKTIKQLYSNKIMNENDIKNLIKQHLKVRVEHQTPHTFVDGYVKVGVYWDNELINESSQKIYQALF